MTSRIRSTHVFINCPFDSGYQPIFRAIVFAVYDLGFVARCALEDDDSGEVRLVKIHRMIEECRFGINDLSTVTLDTVTGLPRFNMPLELGLFLGCKRFGPESQSRKRTLILDSEQYRYRQFISDIAGQDIRATTATRIAPSARFATGCRRRQSGQVWSAVVRSSNITADFKWTCHRSAAKPVSSPIS